MLTGVGGGANMVHNYADVVCRASGESGEDHIKFSNSIRAGCCCSAKEVVTVLADCVSYMRDFLCYEARLLLCDDAYSRDQTSTTAFGIGWQVVTSITPMSRSIETPLSRRVS
jgi:hypothetical protein